MKALLRLALAVLILASVVTVPTSADGYSFTPKQIGGGSFELQCAQFCMVALCAQPEVCGVFIDSNGERACGCHNPYGGPIGS